VDGAGSDKALAYRPDGVLDAHATPLSPEEYLHVLNSRRRVALLASLAALSLLVTSCADERVGEGGENGGSSFSAFLGEPTTLIPTDTVESEGSLVQSALFAGLIDYDAETSEPVDVMAESIESDDNVRWTITIADGWTFHDGTPVTAQSYVDAWNYAAVGTNAQQTSSFFAGVEGYEAVQCGTDADGEPDCEGQPATASELSGLSAPDESTIEVTLSAPFSQFPLTLGYNAFYPLPESFYDDPQAFNEEPVGNGPYRMDGPWRHDEAIDLVRFDDYAGPEAGSADRIELRIYSDSGTAYTDVRAGNLDIVDQIPPEQISAAESEFGERFRESDRSDITFLGFPLYDERFTDPNLRRAFSMAVDREAIVEAIFSGARRPASSFISPVVPGFREDACEYCRFDPEQAAELLEQAGGWDGELVLWFNSGGGHDVWVEAIANQLRTNLGISDITFRQEDFSEYVPRASSNGFDGPFRLGWIMDYPSPENYLAQVFGTGASSNNTGFSDPEFDRLVAEGNAAESIEAGSESYLAAEDIVLEQMPVMPLWFGETQTVHSENVDNVVVDAFGRLRLTEVEVG
jgi:oligopeptide transport system substrate-binding protein